MRDRREDEREAVVREARLDRNRAVDRFAFGEELREALGNPLGFARTSRGPERQEDAVRVDGRGVIGRGRTLRGTKNGVAGYGEAFEIESERDAKTGAADLGKNLAVSASREERFKSRRPAAKERGRDGERLLRVKKHRLDAVVEESGGRFAPGEGAPAKLVVREKGPSVFVPGIKNGRSVSARDMMNQEVGGLGRRSHSPAKRRPMRR